MASNTKRDEEAKRQRCCDPLEQWLALQQAIAFANAQQPVSRNSRERCLELQQQKRRRQHLPG